MSTKEKKELVKIRDEIDIKKRDKNNHAQVGAVALSLALDVKKPDAKHVSFQECLRKVSQKF